MSPEPGTNIVPGSTPSAPGAAERRGPEVPSSPPRSSSGRSAGEGHRMGHRRRANEAG